MNNNVCLYDFNQAKSNVILAFKVFAAMKATLSLDLNGKLTSTSANNDFYVATFNSCNDDNCAPFPDQMSDPSTMPKGIENWNDPQGMPWLSDVTLVFNICLFLDKNG
ncbi:hypothetical protein INT46_002778 [Mucor plumbeus]|uniref:Uncharacterized protein n=1 Tax=Mucor plumbeus TaxID=97098 RepID=A0A8H7UU66_9FUNG|nr:hypothetical protein INT46_002778 [Mucor plumbeus]